MKQFLASLAAGSALLLGGCDTGSPQGVDKLTYHNDPAREGWNDRERMLSPMTVASERFGELWQSPRLDFHGATPPRLFASPLYVSALRFAEGVQANRTLPVAFVVASTGYAYAIHAGTRRDLPAGTILWKRQLTDTPCQDGQFGNLSTPVIDRDANRLYVTSCRGDWIWDIHALDLRTGREVPGWPVTASPRTVTAEVNRNGTSHFVAGQIYYQRGALNLSADGSRLYVAFGPDLQGFLVSVDTRRPRIASAFSSMPREDLQQGGMWGASGPAIDRQGRIYIATGASFMSALEKRGIPGVYPEVAGAWGQSILQFRDEAGAGLKLVGTYSPFNYCQTAASDIDIAGSGAVAFDLERSGSTTPHLLTLGAGKQGNAYLLDRDHMPGSTHKRHACSTDPASDGSLLAPDPQPELHSRGPVVVFGPYSDSIGMVNSAKSRATLAHFRNRSGEHFLYLAGSAKTGPDFGTNIPPSLVRVKVVIGSNRPAYLKVDAREMTQTLQNPGSPVVSSNGGANGVVWVMDTNVPRSVDIYRPDAPGSRLYAFDARTMKLLWQSGDALFTSGKYNEPAVVDGMVLVGTDRLQAFGLRSSALPAGQLQHPAVATTSNQGKALFDGRCAACHTNAGSGAPPIPVIAAYAQDRIVSTLKTGKMKEMGSGLSNTQLAQIAAYVRSGAANR
ncbi:c-type cytochrome [Novosphingobium guangzhouense]|uniref:Cytochrome c domain-containing protein n=1 Tax=Novosphingobium guangzhouense TaxID=1850347 RepID=A0A2K2FWK3_9SPHN|nr:cytochrome c [Novosphingobium guangzhouense]PNU03166.1 hypothetical protein A8V01_24500 [Novosphingobium guangzhouense]